MGQANAVRRSIASTPESECFNFKKPIKKPLVNFSSTVGEAEKGLKKDSIAWGKASKTIDRPIVEVYKLLLDPFSIKDPNRAKVNVKVHTDNPLFTETKNLQITIEPFPFVTVKWNEKWAYELLKGTKEAPIESLLSFQLTEPTPNLQHLCGSVLIKKNDNKTDVFLYEEAKVTGRSEEDILKGHLGTFNTLENKKIKK